MSCFLGWVGKYTLELYMLHVVLRRFFRIFDFMTYRISAELLLVLMSFVLAVVLSRVASIVQRPLLAKPYGK